jgi:formate-dependent nitrite reductase membrane component NrfD
MESIILMNSKWGNDIFVPMYLFFGGLSGGLFVIAVAADLLGIKFKQFENFSRLTSYLVLPVLALAGAFIAFHLGKPERGILFPFFFKNYDSRLVISGWSVGLAVPVAVAYAALWYYKIDATIRRVLGVIAFPILGFVTFYTGLLLSGAKFVPLWSEQYLPYLFSNSGFLNGLAGSGLAFILYQTYENSKKSGQSYAGPVGLATGNVSTQSTKSEDSSGILRYIVYAIVFFELLQLFQLQRFMHHLASNPVKIDNSGYFVAPNGSVMAYEYITQGALAPWFWWGIIGIGLAFPLFLSFVELLFEKLIKPFADWVSGVKFASILVGGAILRFVIVWGGELKAPLTVLPQLNQIPLGG